MSLKQKIRDFIQHLGSYVVVIGGLGAINLLTSDYPWFLWPAIAWGIGLAFHFASLILDSIPSSKWRSLAWDMVSFFIVIGGLGVMNLMTSDYPWFLWPAIAWGMGLGVHFLNTVIGSSSANKTEEEKAADDDRRLERKRRKAEKRRMKEEGDSQPESLVVETESVPAAAESLLSRTAQAHLDKARAYQLQINQMFQATTVANTRARLQELAGQMDEWVKAIETLARRVDDFQGNPLIRQDIEAVPQAIADLETRLARETDPPIRAQLERTLANRQNQLASLERLQKTMQRAEIQIESTLSALGTIYSQVLTGQSTDHVADYSRLAGEVDEEVRLLQDHLEALTEVKLSRE